MMIFEALTKNIVKLIKMQENKRDIKKILLCKKKNRFSETKNCNCIFK